MSIFVRIGNTIGQLVKAVSESKGLSYRRPGSKYIKKEEDGKGGFKYYYSYPSDKDRRPDKDVPGLIQHKTDQDLGYFDDVTAEIDYHVSVLKQQFESDVKALAKSLLDTGKFKGSSRSAINDLMKFDISDFHKKTVSHFNNKEQIGAQMGKVSETIAAMSTFYDVSNWQELPSIYEVHRSHSLASFEYAAKTEDLDAVETLSRYVISSYKDIDRVLVAARNVDTRSNISSMMKLQAEKTQQYIAELSNIFGISNEEARNRMLFRASGRETGEGKKADLVLIFDTRGLEKEKGEIANTFVKEGKDLSISLNAAEKNQYIVFSAESLKLITEKSDVKGEDTTPMTWMTSAMSNAGISEKKQTDFFNAVRAEFDKCYSALEKILFKSSSSALKEAGMFDEVEKLKALANSTVIYKGYSLEKLLKNTYTRFSDHSAINKAAGANAASARSSYEDLKEAVVNLNLRLVQFAYKAAGSKNAVLFKDTTGKDYFSVLAASAVSALEETRPFPVNLVQIFSRNKANGSINSKYISAKDVENFLANSLANGYVEHSSNLNRDISSMSAEDRIKRLLLGGKHTVTERLISKNGETIMLIDTALKKHKDFKATSDVLSAGNMLKFYKDKMSSGEGLSLSISVKGLQITNMLSKYGKDSVADILAQRKRKEPVKIKKTVEIIEEDLWKSEDFEDLHKDLGSDERPNHKYIRREIKNGKVKYIYEESEKRMTKFKEQALFEAKIDFGSSSATEDFKAVLQSLSREDFDCMNCGLSRMQFSSDVDQFMDFLNATNEQRQDRTFRMSVGSYGIKSGRLAYNESNLPPETSSLYRKQLMAHELAHAWYYGCLRARKGLSFSEESNDIAKENADFIDKFTAYATDLREKLSDSIESSKSDNQEEEYKQALKNNFVSIYAGMSGVDDHFAECLSYYWVFPEMLKKREPTAYEMFRAFYNGDEIEVEEKGYESNKTSDKNSKTNKKAAGSKGSDSKKKSANKP